ncbi:MAG TPA: caspase family protein, partial [Acidimicrobiales bacterium]|nr:caspase family protein [Acidimicrobiales bacterium]
MNRSSRRWVAVVLTAVTAVVTVQMVGAHGRHEGLAVADAGLLRGSDLLDRSKLLLPRLAPPTTAAPVAAAAPLAARPSLALERVIAPPPEHFDGPASPQAPPPARLFAPPASTGAGGTWAVMIGINNYPGTKSDLSAAVNDATDVNEALARLGVPGSNRLLIRDGQASAEVIRAAVNWLNERAGPDATAIFFFAGHVRKVGDGRESLVAADGGTVSDADLAARMRGLRAGRVWVGIAACYGGGFNEVLQPGRILTGAAPANSLAYENGGFQRSYMVQYMIREALIEGRAGTTTIEGA